MIPTFDKLREIQRKVFSEESSSYSEDQLNVLKNELKTTYAQASNYPVFRDLWDKVNAELNNLINKIPPQEKPFYSLILKHPIVSGLIVSLVSLAVGAYLSPCKEDKEPASQEDMSIPINDKSSNNP